LEAVGGACCRTVAGMLLVALGYGVELELVLELQTEMSCYCLLSVISWLAQLKQRTFVVLIILVLVLRICECSAQLVEGRNSASATYAGNESGLNVLLYAILYCLTEAKENQICGTR
jgi:hypothetical protein